MFFFTKENLSITKFLIKAGIDLTQTTELWYLAFMQKNYELISLLAEEGININTPDKRGSTVLHKVIFDENTSIYQKIEVMSSLLNNGADINAVNKDGYTPLYEVLKQLNKTPLDPQKKAELCKLKEFLESKGAFNHERFVDYCHKGNFDRAKEYIINCVRADNVNLLCCRTFIHGYNKIPYSHNTIFHEIFDGQASRFTPSQRIELANLMLERGADINIRDKDGDTPLVRAIESHLSEEVIEFLIDKGSNVD